jgi:hypothetical protein
MSTPLLILACLSLFYVGGPLIRVLEREAPPRMRRIPVEEAPRTVAAALWEWKQALGDARLSLVAVQQILPAHIPMPESLPPPSGHVLHFVDRAASVHGLDYVTSAGRWQVFLTPFDDGTEVVTTNYAIPFTFAPHPGRHVARVRGVRDLARLRALHDAHVSLAAGGRRYAAIPGDESLAGFVADHETRTVERQCELGYKRRVDDEYAPTLRGAFRDVWSFLPPLRWVNAVRERRLARTLRNAIR